MAGTEGLTMTYSRTDDPYYHRR